MQCLIPVMKNVFPALVAQDIVGVQPMTQSVDIFRQTGNTKLYINGEHRMISLHSQSVNVNRKDLLQVLIANRELHVKEFSEAIDGYQQAMLDVLAQTTKNVKKGLIAELNLRLAKPASHEDDYTQVIEMLEVSVDEVINLSSDAFQAYYKDKWNWSAGFKALASTYSGAALGR